MRRLLTLLLAVALVGCAGEAEEATTVAPPTTTALTTTTSSMTTSASTTTTSTTLPPTTTAQPEADPREEIDSYLRGLAEGGDFSGAVLVAADNAIILSEGYGLADRELAIANTPQTRFRICSITKQFTAMGILILQDRGLLDVGDLVCDHLSPCPPAWAGMTVHHLLTHTSGLPDFTDLPDYESTQDQPTTPLQLIARFSGLPLRFPPGAKWEYSNSGYVVLGHIIEQLSGLTYGAFIEQAIFGTLGMEASGYVPGLEVVATGYTGSGDLWREAEPIDPSVAYAAGALYSTVEDLYRWNRALETEQLVPHSLLDAMFTPYAATPLGDYGYGWFITFKHNHRVVRHGGGGDGFITVIERYPSAGAAIILLSNRQTADLAAITDTVGIMLFGQ